MASGRNSGRGSTLLLGLSSELRVLPGIGIRLFAPAQKDEELNGTPGTWEKMKNR
jgi:hypothetical protein